MPEEAAEVRMPEETADVPTVHETADEPIVHETADAPTVHETADVPTADAPTVDETVDVSGPHDAAPDDETPEAATARLDAAVQRANADPAASETDGIDEEDASVIPPPVAAGSVRRETYVPAATVAAGTAAGAATLAEERQPVYVAPQPAPQTIYVQAPTPPKSAGNRAFGVLVALVGAAAFALLYAAVAYLLLLGQGDAALANEVFTQFLTRAVFWVPIAAFFIGFTVLAAIVNRGPYWTYAVFGLVIAVLVYFSYIGGSLLTVEAWTLTTEQAAAFIGERWLDPFAIVAAVIAREIPVWLGGWIAARGRAVTDRNREAIEAYDRQLAAGPQVQPY